MDPYGFSCGCCMWLWLWKQPIQDIISLISKRRHRRGLDPYYLPNEDIKDSNEGILKYNTDGDKD